MRFLKYLVVCSFLLPTLASGESLVVILDGSNSMWGRVGGVEKIVVAREVMADVISDISADIEVGFVAYGHRKKEDCKDIEMILAPGIHSQAILKKALNSVTPTGMTPITSALEFVAKRGPEHIVLVSDGKETCKRNPCKALKAIKKSGSKVKVHVVGFDVSEEESKQLQCIAEAGEGRYTDANSAEELVAALGEIKKDVRKESEKQIRLKQYWKLTSDGKVFDGRLSKHLLLGNKKLLQLINREAVNFGFAISGEYEGERTASYAVFAEGRGPTCHLVGKPDSFEIKFETPPDGWIKGTFNGVLGCPDYKAMPVEGEFLVKDIK